MKTNRFLALAASIAAVLCLNSCEKPTPDDGGDEVEVEVADVFFSSENGDYCYYVTPDGSTEAVIKVFRENATEEAEYAIKVISADNGIEIPSSVKFVRGANTSSLSVKAPSSGKVGDIFSFEIMFTGNNVNPSANSSEGTLRCEGSFYFYEVLNTAACFQPWGETGDIFYYMGYMKQTIWKLDAKTYIFKDFLGNKHDLKVITADNGIITQFVYDYYDLYLDKVDGDNGSYLYFYNEDIEEFAEENYNELFAPKGDARSFSELSVYTDPSQAYSMYVKDGNYFYFAVPTVTFYVEDGDRSKEYNWQYLCFYIQSEDKLAEKDFVGFPDIPEASAGPEFPEADSNSGAQEGSIAMNFYLNAEEVYLDTQYADLVDGNYVIKNFMWSDCTLTLKPAGSSFTIEVTDAEGNLVSGSVKEGYRYLGMEYIYPWAKDYNWCIYGLQMYDEGYCTWDAEAKEAYFYGSYTVYDGTNGGWLETSADYISIYW